LIKKKVLRHYL